jgi:hypothetical protein
MDRTLDLAIVAVGAGFLMVSMDRSGVVAGALFQVEYHFSDVCERPGAFENALLDCVLGEAPPLYAGCAELY